MGRFSVVKSTLDRRERKRPPLVPGWRVISWYKESAGAGGWGVLLSSNLCFVRSSYKFHTIAQRCKPHAVKQ